MGPRWPGSQRMIGLCLIAMYRAGCSLDGLLPSTVTPVPSVALGLESSPRGRLGAAALCWPSAVVGPGSLPLGCGRGAGGGSVC